MPGFDPFLFRVLWHCAQILLSFSASCPDFPHLPRHRVRASLIFFGIASSFHYLFRHYVRIFLIFLGIMSEHHLYFSASCPAFSSSSSTSCLSIAYLFRHRFRLSLSFPASCPSIAYLFRHCVRISPIFTGIVSGSLIFPGIVLGFLLVLQSWRLSSISLRYWVRGQNCWSSGFFTRVHFILASLVLHTHDSLIHSLY